MSGIVTYANYTISSTSARISNVTAITGCVETCVINFTMYATDTNNNVKQNSTLIVVADRTPPVVNTSLNKTLTSIFQNDVINFSANVTDGAGLSFCQIIINQSGPDNLHYENISLNGATSAQCYNVTGITLLGGSVINFTIRVNDTSGNTRTNDTIITVVDNIFPVVNTSFNKSLANIQQNDVINFSANVTDGVGLSFCQFVDNQSLANGAKQFINKSVTGTGDQCSQNFTIVLPA